MELELEKINMRVQIESLEEDVRRLNEEISRAEKERERFTENHKQLKQKVGNFTDDDIKISWNQEFPEKKFMSFI